MWLYNTELFSSDIKTKVTLNDFGPVSKLISSEKRMEKHAFLLFSQENKWIQNNAQNHN